MFRFKSIPHLAAATVILLGTLTLGGWLLNISFLKTVFPGLVSMKANSALCWIFAGTSLWLQIKEGEASRRQLSVARLLAGIVILMALLTLLEYAFGIDVGLDRLLFRESAKEAGNSFPGRMSLATGFDIVLLGAALLSLDIKISGTRRWPAQYLTLAAAVVTLLAFVGYFYGVESLSRLGPYSTIALNTVLSSWLLCVGILFARPKHGLMAVFTSDDLGGLLARRMLPAAILVPLLGGWLSVLGQRAGFYGLGFGSALYATSLIVTFSALVVWAAGALSRADTERRRGADALRQSSARLDAIISSAMDAVISVDAQRRIVLFNPAAEKMFGINSSAALGGSIARFIPERFGGVEADRAVEGTWEAGGARLTEAVEAVTAVRAGGDRFPAEASISEVEIAGEKLFTVIVRDVTERHRAEQELSLSREKLRSLAARLQAVREEERTQVAREIHDVLAQELTRLKMDITWVNRQLAQPLAEPRRLTLQAKLAGMSDVTDTAITSVQRIATDLRPVVLDSLGLCAAVEWQAKDFEARTGTDCRASVPESDLQLNRDYSTALFRILQESLTNIARHATATRVRVELKVQDRWLCLLVRDNGRGIRASELCDPRSLGLLGMRERATLLGGECQITRTEEGGTSVEARLPFPPNLDSLPEPRPNDWQADQVQP